MAVKPSLPKKENKDLYVICYNDPSDAKYISIRGDESYSTEKDAVDAFISLYEEWINADELCHYYICKLTKILAPKHAFTFEKL